MQKWMQLLVLILPFTLSAQSVKRSPVETKMEKITVFMKGAQVKRTAKQMISAGKQEIVFRGISTDIEKQSVQVRADGKLTLLSVKVQRDFLNEQEVRTEIKNTETQQQQLDEKLTLTRKMLEVYKQEEAMILKNQSIGGNTTLKPEELKQSLDFQRLRLTEVLKQQLALEKEIVTMEKERNKLLYQLAEMNKKADLSTNEIVVLADVKESTTIPFEITYMVKKAGWYPVYNIRVKDVVSPLSVEMNANVYQTSGENWNNVKLVLSTGNPEANNTKPVINPWMLYYVDANLSNFMKQMYYGNDGQWFMGRVTDNNGIPVAGASVLVKGSNTGTITDENGFYKIKAGNVPNPVLVISSVGYSIYEFAATKNFVNIGLQQADKSLSEVVVTGYGTRSDLGGAAPGVNVKVRGNASLYGSSTPLQVETTYQPTTVQYEIQEITTIVNDGKMNTISISETVVAAYYEYYIAPKLEQAAFLTANISNWQDLNLIPGETNLFFEGTYLGKSYLDLSEASDTLSLSLGVDKGIAVERKLAKDYSTKKFLGSNKTETKQFEITVRNNKTVPVNIIIEDQLPVSTQKEIEVNDEKYEGAKLNDDTKIVTWSYTIDPKQQKKMELKYSVKYPKDKNLKLD